MSGLVGVWNLDGQPVAASLLARLSATLAHRGPDGEGHWIQGPVGLACQQFRVTPESAHETQPVADASGAAVIFDGRLDNRQDVLDRLDVSAGVSAQSGDAALVLAAYHQAGEHLPEWLLGDFAFVLFDPRKQQMLLARDAIGGIEAAMQGLDGYAIAHAAPNSTFQPRNGGSSTCQASYNANTAVVQVASAGC